MRVNFRTCKPTLLDFMSLSLHMTTRFYPAGMWKKSRGDVSRTHPTSWLHCCSRGSLSVCVCVRAYTVYKQLALSVFPSLSAGWPHGVLSWSTGCVECVFCLYSLCLKGFSSFHCSRPPESCSVVCVCVVHICTDGRREGVVIKGFYSGLYKLQLQ